MQQKRSRIFMVRPVGFGFNGQTAASNSFQQAATASGAGSIQQLAAKEFDVFVKLLRSKEIDVIVFDDTAVPHTPDSIFPNNWISFHENKIVLYPMLAENRRPERRPDMVEQLIHPGTELIDLSGNEQNGIFLEGTGSMVFDYKNRIAYASLSPRTNRQLFETLCSELKYEAVTFEATDAAGAAIYHTNVLMCIGENFAVICKECIVPEIDAERVLESLSNSDHEIITISGPQMNSFAGNMYQLFNAKGESFIVMSEQAYQSLTTNQIAQLEKHGDLLHVNLKTIEKYGGGSARCMIADVK